MSPVQATLVFISAYQAAFKTSFRSNIDKNHQSLCWASNPAKLVSAPGEFTRVWIARQRADGLGMNYPGIFGFAFRFANDRKRKMLPRPNQLHPTVRSAVAWDAKMANTGGTKG